MSKGGPVQTEDHVQALFNKQRRDCYKGSAVISGGRMQQDVNKKLKPLLQICLLETTTLFFFVAMFKSGHTIENPYHTFKGNLLSIGSNNSTKAVPCVTMPM